MLEKLQTARPDKRAPTFSLVVASGTWIKRALRSLKLLSDLYNTYSQRYRPASVEDSAPTASSPNSQHLLRQKVDLILGSLQMSITCGYLFTRSTRQSTSKTVSRSSSSSSPLPHTETHLIGRDILFLSFFKFKHRNVAVSYLPSPGHFPLTSFLR